MPFNQRTPECLIERADSKNPATTCKGITSNGRPCRRALASLKLSPAKQSGHGAINQDCVLAVVKDGNGSLADVGLYCWQHKDQAENLGGRTSTTQGRKTTLIPIQRRTSVDSLVERLGLATLDEPKRQSVPTRGIPTAQYRQHINRTPLSANEDAYGRADLILSAQHRKQRSRPKPSFWSSLCCMTRTNDDDDYVEVVRHKKRVQQMEERSARPAMLYSAPSPRDSLQPMPSPPKTPTATPSSKADEWLSLISPTLSQRTTSQLLAELAKPLSAHDEAGYIYIFWLTDDQLQPSSDDAASLLDDPRTRRSNNDRSAQLLRTYSRRQAKSVRKTIMLKIGRASNVHRRMNEWTRQCGYNLSLVRWYPYVSSSNTPSPTTSPTRLSPPSPSLVRKVSHAHRVERLIHLELQDQRVKRDCGQCGKEHREWFEVEATERGVRAVDEVVRKWVGWAERNLGADPGR